jgi:hypothetical protein
MKLAAAAALSACIGTVGLLGGALAEPATNGFNWGGGLGIISANGETRYYGDQTLVAPVGSLAYQLDASIYFGSGPLTYDIEGMLFARDPMQGHVGVFSSYVGYRVGNPNMDRVQVGVDGAWYRDRWTFQGMVGFEFDGFQHGGGVPQGFGVNVAAAAHYYVTDNWRVWAGLGHVSGANMLVIGTEFDPGSVLAGTTRLIARATISTEGMAFLLGGKWRIGGEPRSTLMYDDRHEYATMLHSGTLGFAPTTFRY